MANSGTDTTPAAPPSVDLNIPRDRHLFGPGPKRILSLDGGGVRGVITIAFLERIEAILKESPGTNVRLSDHFDLIGGTSTGSIIAAGLALGMSASDVKQMYFDLAPNVFKTSWFRVKYLRARFSAHALRNELELIIGNRKLDSLDLKTGFCVVAKRMDTGSAWSMTNNPCAPYWETPPDNTYLGNRHYRLANIVRASTAAPTFFAPERLPIGDNINDGLFVDGGVSPYNNPVIALLLQSQLAAFKLNWKTGPENLKIVSIGTGIHRHRMEVPSRAVTALRKARQRLDVVSTMSMAIDSLKTVIDDAEQQSLQIMQWLGDTPKEMRWYVNSEVRHMHEDIGLHRSLFRFFRYNVRLERDFLKDEVGVTCSDEELEELRLMENVDMMQRCYEIGQKAAEKQIRPEHWKWPAKNPALA